MKTELDEQAIDPGPDKIIAPGFSYKTVTDKIAGVVLKPIQTTPKQWWISLFLAFCAMQGLMAGAFWLLYKGVGVWGIMIPVGWGFAIVNFVWWIGIGHAGTLISAILLLLKQDWRTSINRFAEAMTLFAVAQAGMFPILHMGRPWLGYWLIPYPSSMWLWPQPRSPLVWDVFAVTTYLTVSLIFWYIGLVPDLATMRDKAKQTWQKVTFGMLALGWRGSARHWARYQMAYLLLGGLATPLVVSVHTVVSFDFAISMIPGWHTTIFPPYFVAGAIYSGFAMVLTLAIPTRKWFHLEDLITMRHLDCLRQADARNGADRRLRLHDGSLHVLVQRQSLRDVYVQEPHHGSLRDFFRDVDLVQYPDPAVAVVIQGAPEHPPGRNKPAFQNRRENRSMVFSNSKQD